MCDNSKDDLQSMNSSELKSKISSDPLIKTHQSKNNFPQMVDTFQRPFGGINGNDDIHIQGKNKI